MALIKYRGSALMATITAVFHANANVTTKERSRNMQMYISREERTSTSRMCATRKSSFMAA